MNNDFSELIQYLDDKFHSINSQLEYLKENKTDKSDFRELMTSVDATPKKPIPIFRKWLCFLT